MLAREQVAAFIMSVPAGSVSTLVGVGLAETRLLLDATEPSPADPVAIALTPPATTAAGIVEYTLEVLARAALGMWPVWFTDVDFSPFERTALGHDAARLRVKEATASMGGVILPWAEHAVALALEGRLPRVRGIHAATEIRQLCQVVSRTGVVLVLAPPSIDTAVFVHAAEWMARSAAPVVVTLEDMPGADSGFERWLHGATVIAPAAVATQAQVDEPSVWIAPVTGRPHPLSETECRLAAALARDDELRSLFSFNQFVDTVRGLRPKVDLLWSAGRLAIELDGYADHGTRRAFRHDRHRDYELIMSGYTVFRLANDEIAEDLERAIDKIRDVVRFRRQFM